jgi:hypothetical protein
VPAAPVVVSSAGAWDSLPELLLVSFDDGSFAAQPARVRAATAPSAAIPEMRVSFTRESVP